MTTTTTTTSLARGLGIAGVLLATSAAAQSPSDIFRPAVESARLGSGYAQIVGLAATPDISAASYDIHDDPADLSLDVYRLPYQSKWRALSPEADLYWRLAGGYLQLKQDSPVVLESLGIGSVDSRWSAYSVSAGVLAKIRLGSGFTLEPALDFGVARLENRASYNGAAVILQPFLDGIAFNWHTDAWLATPSIALQWSADEADHRMRVRAHVARSWISTFSESDPILAFNEAANAYSIRASYAAPTGARALDRPLDWVVYGGYAGFFGANRDALGFSEVAEIGAGLEAPMAAGSEKSDRVRLGGSYLFGPDATGWTVSIGLQY